MAWWSSPRASPDAVESMKVWLADPNTIRVEQDVDGQPGPPDQSLTFRRITSSAPTTTR